MALCFSMAVDLLKARLAQVRETADPEMRVLIDGVMREEPSALEAVRVRGELASRLLRTLRAPDSMKPTRPVLRLVHSVREP